MTIVHSQIFLLYRTYAADFCFAEPPLSDFTCTQTSNIPYVLNFYRPQTKFAKVMFSDACLSTGERVCVSQHTLGRAVCIPACTGQGDVYPSMHWAGGCVCLGGVCLGGYLPGGCLPAGCSPGPEVDTTPHPPPILWETVNKRAVRIPQKCILVYCFLCNARFNFCIKRYFIATTHSIASEKQFHTSSVKKSLTVYRCFI